MNLKERVSVWRTFSSALTGFQAFWLAFGVFGTLSRLQLRTTGLNVVVRRKTSDVRVLRDIFVRKEYDIPFSIDPEIIIDAGAHIGLSVLFFRSVFPRAKIIAVEPNRQNYELLQRNCEGLANVKLIQAALWSKKTEIYLENPDASPWEYTFTERPSGDVPTQTITPLELLEMSGGRIGLFKLDIEGAEKALFESGESEWLRKVDVLAIELHDRYLPGCSAAFYRSIVGCNFRQELSGENVFVDLRGGWLETNSPLQSSAPNPAVAAR
jgi:FkbM family methyltransferase